MNLTSTKPSKKEGCKKDDAEVTGPGYRPGMKMNDYLSEIRKLLDAGEYKAALERHLWFHDHALEIEPAMYGVRLSFALSDWRDLCDVYPSALTAMKKIRDDKTALFAQGQGTYALFHDVESLNSHLQDDGKTVDLFRLIEERDAALATTCWKIMKDVAVRIGDISLARKYMVDLQSDFEELRKECEDNLKTIAKKDQMLKKMFQESFVAQTVFLIRVAQAAGQKDLAVKLQKDALPIASGDEIRNALNAFEK